MTNNKKGFTLIELLVVIAIIGILSAIGLVSLNGAREKARDAQRKSDLATMRTAMALYFDDHTNAYPGASIATGKPESVSVATGFVSAMGPSGGNYLPVIPAATGAATACDKANNYWYAANNSAAGTDDATHFALAAILESAGCKLAYVLTDQTAGLPGGNGLAAAAGNAFAAGTGCGGANSPDLCATTIPATGL